jgi:hypothetical protein
MISRRGFVKLGACAIAAISLPRLVLNEERAEAAEGSAAEASFREVPGKVGVVAAYEWIHQSRNGTTITGFEETLGPDPTAGAGQGGEPDMGSTISLFLSNQGSEALLLDKVLFDGIDTASLFDTPPYRIIWNRLLPSSLAPGQEGELTISLRSRLTKPVTVTVSFKNGSRVIHSIAPNTARLRIGTIGFAADLASCHIYIERVDPTAPPSPQSLVKRHATPHRCALAARRFY